MWFCRKAAAERGLTAPYATHTNVRNKVIVMKLAVKKIANKQPLYIAVIMIVVAVILWSLTGQQEASVLADTSIDPWEQGWVQIIAKDEYPLTDMNAFVDVGAGATLVLENEIPSLRQNAALFFYTKDIEVTVFAGEELIYSFEMQEKYEFLKTPGNKWNKVVIPAEYSGETIRIELTSQFPNRFTETVTGLYLVDEIEVALVYFSHEWLFMTLATMLGVSAITAFICSFFWEGTKVKQYFLGAGLVTLCIFLWAVGMGGYWDFFLKNAITSYLLSIIMVPIIPVAIYEFSARMVFRKSKIIKYYGVAIWADLFVQLVLQFVFGVSILSLIPLSTFMYTAGCVLVIGLITADVVNYIKSKGKYPLQFQLVSLTIVFVAAIIECGIVLLFPENASIYGLTALGGVILYLNINTLFFIKQESKTDGEKEILERKYYNLENTVSVQQIEAHSFFNTLNTISALCKDSAEEADKAIVTLAQYMRNFMHLIVEQKAIDFSEEIRVTEGMLSIEALRFPDKVRYVHDFEYTDFKLPPLSLQPFVENAMIHGLRPRAEGGVITISTKKTGAFVKIVIEDTGVGYDTNAQSENKAIGMHNAEKRIRMMSKGYVYVESEIGKGTKVTIELPLTNV